MKLDLDDIRTQLSPGWSPVTIALVVILFWIFWPLGLLMVAYNIWGDRLNLDLSRPETFQGIIGRTKRGFQAAISGFNEQGPTHTRNTGTPKPDLDRNSFEQWRKQEQDKISAAKEALEREKKDFEEMKRSFYDKAKADEEA